MRGSPQFTRRLSSWTSRTKHRFIAEPDFIIAPDGTTQSTPFAIKRVPPHLGLARDFVFPKSNAKNLDHYPVRFPSHSEARLEPWAVASQKPRPVLLGSLAFRTPLSSREPSNQWLIH